LLDASQVASTLYDARRSFAEGRGAAARESCLAILHSLPDEPGALHLLGLMALRDGDARGAKDLLRRAAESPTTNATYLLSYAELICRPLDRAAALAMTRRAIALDANLPLGWFSLGNQLLDLREYAESKSCFERAVRLDLTMWQARAQLAVVLERLGHSAEALECFRQLLNDEAGNADVIDHYAAFLADLGRYAEALIQAELAISQSPNSLDHHLRAADIETQIGRHGSALERLRAIGQQWPNEVKLKVLEANLLRLLDRYDEAVALCRDALSKGVESADMLRAYALALHLAGEDGEALEIFDRATTARPALALSDKAVLLTQLGRFSDACATFDQALSHEPALVDAWYNKTNAKTYQPQDPDIGAMQRLLEGHCVHRERVLLHFALGKAQMDAGNTDAAFAHWHQGNRLKREIIEYDEQAAERHLAAIAAGPPNAAARNPLTRARLSELPVFIVGMPRCGSSLVEQIVASHPDVHGAGEQTRVRTLFEAKRPEFGGSPDDNEVAEKALLLLRRFSPRAERMVDKDLANFMHLGVIHRIFPHARIIHCRRDPVDTCFSAYTKLFLGDLPFTYDLREMGLYYRHYHTLMAHWRAVLPSRIFMEVDYESLVSEPHETARRLVGFLGLTWDEGCARFFETRRAVNTASAAQVRRPVYRSSVGRSASMLSYLEPLTEALGELASSARID
jgi:tetratricopeptide (TPR) repeat protein